MEGKSGLAGKSQPPALLRFTGKRSSLCFRLHKVLIETLIPFVATKAFPGEPFNRQVVKEVIGTLIAPNRCIRCHTQHLADNAQVERNTIPG